MEGFIALFVVAGALLVLGALANAFGTDSRPDYVDDWAREAAR